jgi:hypothetical protein
VAEELNRLRQLSSNPSWAFEQVDPALRLVDENANQHLASATFMKLAEEAKFQVGIEPSVSISASVHVG